MVQKGHVPLGSLLQAMERVVLPLAKHCSAAAVGSFFVSNISDVSATLLARFTKVGLMILEELGSDSCVLNYSLRVERQTSLSLFQTNVAEFEVQILKKIGCYKLMELMYSRLPKEDVYSKESSINRAFCRTDTAEGNELSKTLIK